MHFDNELYHMIFLLAVLILIGFGIKNCGTPNEVLIERSKNETTLVLKGYKKIMANDDGYVHEQWICTKQEGCD